MRHSDKTLRLILCLLILVSVRSVLAQTAAQEKGPKLGEKLPAFRARDQFGREQNAETLTGSKGFVMLFFRSADW
jgi:hypothetical protein